MYLTTIQRELCMTPQASNTPSGSLAPFMFNFCLSTLQGLLSCMRCRRGRSLSCETLRIFYDIPFLQCRKQHIFASCQAESGSPCPCTIQSTTHMLHMCIVLVLPIADVFLYLFNHIFAANIWLIYIYIYVLEMVIGVFPISRFFFHSQGMFGSSFQVDMMLSRVEEMLVSDD